MQNTTLAPKASKWHDHAPKDHTSKNAILPTENAEYLMTENDLLNKFLTESNKLEQDIAKKKK